MSNSTIKTSIVFTTESYRNVLAEAEKLKTSVNSLVNEIIKNKFNNDLLMVEFRQALQVVNSNNSTREKLLNSKNNLRSYFIKNDKTEIYQDILANSLENSQVETSEDILIEETEKQVATRYFQGRKPHGIYFPVRFYNAMKSLCYDKGVSISSYMQGAINDYFEMKYLDKSNKISREIFINELLEIVASEKVVNSGNLETEARMIEELTSKLD